MLQLLFSAVETKIKKSRITLYSNMALFSEGGVSAPDIWIASSIILIAVISVALNPLVFRHNYCKKRSIARDLFMALSATDFISSIVLTTFVSSGVLAPIEEQCKADHNSTFCNTEYYKYIRTATATEKACSGLMWTLAYIPMIIVATQAIARWYQITYPLRNLNKTAVEIALGVSCLTWTIFSHRFLFHDSSTNPAVFKIAMQAVSHIYLNTTMAYFPLILVISLTSISTIASAFTVRNIVKYDNLSENQQARRRKLRSSMKIAVMNAGNLGWEIVAIARFSLNKENDKTLYILQSLLTFLSIAQSTYNPVVYFFLTDRILHNSRIRESLN